MTIEQTEFRMLLDTGSLPIWVPADCVDRTRWVGRTLLNVAQSTSLSVSGDLFYAMYGAGEISGLKATVDIKLGGMLIRNVPFGLVMEATRGIYEEPVDGYIGLGRLPVFSLSTSPLSVFVREQGLMSGQFGFEFQDDSATFIMGDNLEQVLPTGGMAYTTVNGDAMCATRFQNGSASTPVGILLGMSFLHSFQLIFDDQACRVGLAPRQGRISEESDKLERDKRAVIRIRLYRWGGAQYFCPLGIGETRFRMLLDTGSPSIWIASDRVDRSLWVGRTLLSVAQTPSLRISREIFYDVYGTGEISGLKATVDMELGGMLIRNVPFGLVMDATREIYTEPIDGYIGLGRPPICPDNTSPLHIFVCEQGLMSGQFGFEFQDDGATFIMGDNLEQVIPSTAMVYVNVIQGRYWEIRVDRFSIGRVTLLTLHVPCLIPLCRISISNTEISTEDYRAIFDTGTHTMILPGDIHMAINQELGISRLVDGAYVFECSRLPSMRPIAFHIQGNKFHITRTQYTKQTTVNGDAMCSTRFLNKTAKLPVGIILGMSFLHSFQLMFDHERSRVGFAPRHERSSIV
ncbi:eukaryotic aspartyl protease [Opisthorchis viverrini]|uniref:Eukaryotic aspartyl protease n=1 Tax=Opisthorchis viverrini TaxID=6198 RepID=A0A1S8WQG4_OPIVI|nr:eukaryotic aspartyl protease [Opisthorchis viverrini]